MAAVISAHTETGDAAQPLFGTLNQTANSRSGKAANIVSHVLDAVAKR